MSSASHRGSCCTSGKLLCIVVFFNQTMMRVCPLPVCRVACLADAGFWYRCCDAWCGRGRDVMHHTDACRYMVPHVTEYWYFHKLQSAYGFGDPIMSVWAKRNKIPLPLRTKDKYAKWNHMSSGDISDPMAAAATSTHQTDASGERANPPAPSGGGANRSLAADTHSPTMRLGQLRGATNAVAAAGRERAPHTQHEKHERRTAVKNKNKNKKQKKHKEVKLPPPPRPFVSHVSSTHRTDQVRDLVADVSDQMVLYSIRSVVGCGDGCEAAWCSPNPHACHAVSCPRLACVGVGVHWLMVDESGAGPPRVQPRPKQKPPCRRRPLWCSSHHRLGQRARVSPRDVRVGATTMLPPPHDSHVLCDLVPNDRRLMFFAVCCSCCACMAYDGWARPGKINTPCSPLSSHCTAAWMCCASTAAPHGIASATSRNPCHATQPCVALSLTVPPQPIRVPRSPATPTLVVPVRCCVDSPQSLPRLFLGRHPHPRTSKKAFRFLRT